MHRYRSAAKREAWYDDPDGPTNWNPFGKIRSRTEAITKDDEENATRTQTAQSDNFLSSPVEQRRRSQNMEGYQVPKHADTMPNSAVTPSSGPSVTMKAAEINRDSIEKSQDSGTGSSDIKLEPLGSEKQPPPEANEAPRRRRRVNPFHHDKEAEGAPEVQKPKKSRRLFKRSTDKGKYTVMSQIRATVFNSYINILLIFVPIGIAVKYVGLAPVAVFVLNFVAIIPLAAMLSYATEEIAIRVGETIGGLLNATFGNAVELIVSIIALIQGQVDIVQESLIGSMLSNLLLVMGMCFFFGGLNRVKQHFNVTVAQTASSLLALAVGSLIIPAAFQAWADGAQSDKSSRITAISRGTAILLLVVYGCYLLFQLKTHASMYNAPSKKVEKRYKKIEKGDANKGLAQIGAGISASMGGQATQETPVQEPEEETEQPQLTKWVAIATLAISTALVAICAEGMVDSINGLTDNSSVLSRTFVGLILLPIVGNAAEHATAVTVACKDKMDLAIGVAVGSSMQIALLVIPFTVILGWILGNEKMNLAFDGFQIAVLFVSILLVNYLIQDGESHWLEGVLLQILYLIIAITAWFYPRDDPNTINTRALLGI